MAVLNINRMYQYERTEQEVKILNDIISKLPTAKNKKIWDNCFEYYVAGDNLNDELTKILNYKTNKMKKFKLENAELFI